MVNRLFIPLLLLVFCSCSNTRWTIVDTEAVDSRDQPRVLGSSYEIHELQSPTLRDPYLSIAVQQINDVEVPQRVLVERTVQRYRPRPLFTLFGALGAGVAFYVANSDAVFSNLTHAQSVAFNATGLLITTMTLTNLEPVGEPIRTGEQKYLRRSGEIIRKDTVSVASDLDFTVEISVEYEGSVIYSEESEVTGSDALSLNLVNLLENRDVVGSSPGDVIVTVGFLEDIETFNYPVTSFMTPVIRIHTPVAQIRSEPVISNSSLFSDVGAGSELSYLGALGGQWYEVQFGGSTVYVAQEDGEILWTPVQNGASPTVYTVSEIPFGDLPVENSVPVIRDSGESDAGLIISNHDANQIGQRNYIDRDLQLMNLYFRNAFDLTPDRIHQINFSDSVSYSQALDRVETDSSSAMFVYLEGFARIAEDSLGNPGINLVHLGEEGELSAISLDTILGRIARLTGNQLVVFADLELDHDYQPDTGGSRRQVGSDVLLRSANRVMALEPNSTIVFSSRTDQTSGVYASERFDNMHHHIYPYYIALGIQQRLTRMNELIRYLENQVDYTSRLLHDRPQEIQSFGNLTIDLSD